MEKFYIYQHCWEASVDLNNETIKILCELSEAISECDCFSVKSMRDFLNRIDSLLDKMDASQHSIEDGWAKCAVFDECRLKEKAGCNGCLYFKPPTA